MGDSILEINKKVGKLDNIEIRPSKFYGKLPKFFIRIDPLTDKDVEYDDILYLKMFMAMYNIKEESFISLLDQSLINSQKWYQNSFLKDKENNTMVLYMNYLALLCKNNLDGSRLRSIYKMIINSPNLNKFPLLFLKYVTEYTELLMKDGLSEDNAIILNNLVSIASIRALNAQEEE